MNPDRFPKIEVTSAEALWAWLDRHHRQAESVWLVTWKKANPEKYVSREEVLDALIAYGWIDGVRKAVDAEKTMQLISPRQQRAWAESYKLRAARLEAEGRMRAPGRAAIEASKTAGLWDAQAEVDALTVPEDLMEALGAGRAWYEAAAPSYRRNVLRWIAGAKTAATRERRVAAVASHAAEGRKVPQF